MNNRSNNTAQQKFHRYLYTIEVLSEDPLPDNMSLHDIAYEITEGHCSGKFLPTHHTVIGPKLCAKLLRGQGSDPEFFGIKNDN